MEKSRLIKSLCTMHDSSPNKSFEEIVKDKESSYKVFRAQERSSVDVMKVTSKDCYKSCFLQPMV